MTLIKGVAAKGSTNIPYPTVAGVVVAAIFSHAFKAEPAAGDIVEIGMLPQGCKAIDVLVTADGLDAANAIEFDLGLITGEYASNDQTRTCGAEFLAGSTVAQAGGIERPSKASAYRVPASSRERGLGLKVKTAPGGFVAGTVTVTLQYSAA
jgi:hypothetical protein